MNAAELTAALEQWPAETPTEPVSAPVASPPPAARPSTRGSQPQHIAAGLDLEGPARTMARHQGLLDSRGQLHCWRCHRACPWSVHLHCEPCLNLTKYEQPQRDEQERQRRLAEQEAKRMRMQQGAQPPAPTRRFRDDY